MTKVALIRKELIDFFESQEAKLFVAKKTKHFAHKKEYISREHFQESKSLIERDVVVWKKVHGGVPSDLEDISAAFEKQGIKKGEKLYLKKKEVEELVTDYESKKQKEQLMVAMQSETLAPDVKRALVNSLLMQLNLLCNPKDKIYKQH